jgi:hypothetical protein
MSGKGDAGRPLSVDRETYARNWEQVFGRPMTRLCMRCSPGEAWKHWKGPIDQTCPKCEPPPKAG